MKELFSLEQNVCVITGGAGLLGQALVRAFRESGATVYLTDVDDKKGQKLVDEFKDKKIKYHSLDITSEKSVTRALSTIKDAEGKIDVWINNAYPRTKDWHVKLSGVPFSSWQENINMHLNGYFLCSQKAAELMKKKKSGCIINLASIYGIAAPDFSLYEGTDKTMPAAYAAIKGGIVQMTKYFAAYYGPEQVRVNSISPGGIFDNQESTFVQRYEAKVPLRRMAKVEDITGAAVFLASKAAAYMTGHNLVVDGGLTII